MIIDRLIVHNLTSIRHVDLPLHELPVGSIIALVGPFGVGKTTLLEAPFAALYRTFPSRDVDLKTVATDRDSFIDVQFRRNAYNRCHARVNIDATSGKSDATLEIDDVPFNDGKVTTYDEVVRRTFPPKDLFLAAALATQNKRGNFVTKSAKEKAELFSELLGQTSYARMSDGAKSAVQILDAKLVALRAAHEEAGHALRIIPVLAAPEDVRALRAQTEARREALDERLGDLERQVAMMGDADAAYSSTVQRLETIRRQKAAREAERVALGQERTRAGQALVSEQQTLDRRQRAWLDQDATALRTQLADFDTKLANNRALQGQAEQIRAAVTALQDIATREQELRQQLTDNYEALESARTLVTHAQDRAAHHQTIVRLRDEAQQQAALLERVPFGDRCAEAGCEFVSGAAIAKRRLPELEATAAATAGAIETLRQFEASVTGLTAAVQGFTAEERDLQTQKGRHQALAALTEKLAAAEARIDALEAARAQATLDAERRRTDAEAEYRRQIDVCDGRRVAAARAFDDRETALAQAATLLKDEEANALAVLDQVRGDHEAIVSLRGDLAAARQKRDEVVRMLADLDGTLRLEREREAARTDLALRLTRLSSQVAALTQQAIEWTTLQQALGRDGIPKLEIDAAGPWIAQTTTDLLAATFGPRFSVDLVTQQAKADGGLKEALDLLVLDNAGGGSPRRIGQLSGGEQIIISEALMSALAIYVQQHSGHQMQTIWRDETAGGLNPEARAQYFAMLRRVMQIGGYHHLYMVTHDMDIATLADAQIVVGQGTARIVTPPYGNIPQEVEDGRADA